MTLPERIDRWRKELARLAARRSRWGECRRFAGKSAGLRIARMDWLRQHIAAAQVKLQQTEGGAMSPKEIHNMRKQKRLTAREFAASVSTGQTKCPACGSENIVWGEINVEGNSTYQEARCADCGAGFNTVSRLVGYMFNGLGEPQTVAEDFGEITETPPRRITVDYRLLDRQIKLLCKCILPADERKTAALIQTNMLLDGLFEFLCRIAEDRPFPEVRDP